MKVAIYARVSTTNHGQDVGVQTREQHQFADARGWQVYNDYIDLGVSGSKDSRPELNRLMADAHKRRFDVVCVWKFDLFAILEQGLLLRLKVHFQETADKTTLYSAHAGGLLEAIRTFVAGTPSAAARSDAPTCGRRDGDRGFLPPPSSSADC